MEFKQGIMPNNSKKIFVALLAILMTAWSAKARFPLHGYIANKTIMPSRKVLYRRANKKALAGKKIQKLGQKYFYRLFESKFPGILGKISIFIQKKIHKCPLIYNSDLIENDGSNPECCYDPKFGTVELSKLVIDIFKDNTPGMKAALQHEMVHGWQYSSYLRKLKLIWPYLTGGTKKARYFEEYQADQKTIEQMYKEKNYKEIAAKLDDSTDILCRSARYHPYRYSTLDTYFKLLKKYPENQKLKNCFHNNCSNVWVKARCRNFKPKSWKERYRECAAL